MGRTSSSENLQKNIFLNTLGNLVYYFCQWLMTILVVHLASYSQAGYLSLAMNTSTSFAVIALFSMRNFQISDVRHEYTRHEYAGSRVLTCLAAFISCAVYAFAANSVFQALCITAFMLIRIAEDIVDVLHGENQKKGRYDYICRSYLMRGLASIVLFSLVLKLSGNLFVTLLAVAAVNLIIAFAYDWVRTSSLAEIKPVMFSRHVLKLLGECLPITVFTFLLNLEMLIPKQVLKAVVGYDELGIYSSIASPTLVIQLFATVAFSPIIPKLSAYLRDGEFDRFASMLRKTYLLIAGIAVLITAGAALLGRWGLTLLFGKSILSHYSLFMPVVWVSLLIGFIFILQSILIAMRQMKWMLIGMIADFALCCALVYPCINHFGSNGASIVQIIAYGVYLPYMIAVAEIQLYNMRNRHKS